MLLFDIGANRGDAVIAGLNKGYGVVACEPAPKIFKELAKNFIYDSRVIPLKVAISDSDNQRVEFYEADEDGLSTLNKEWLTSSTLPYSGKPFRTIQANTLTLDTLVDLYGTPDLIKIDVEGAEWLVFKGMTQNHGKLTFEWTDATINEHCEQIEYLQKIGYSEVAPQFIVQHLEEPTEWFPIKGFDLKAWISSNKNGWEKGGWKEANLRPTADVGMLWVR